MCLLNFFGVCLSHVLSLYLSVVLALSAGISISVPAGVCGFDSLCGAFVLKEHHVWHQRSKSTALMKPVLTAPEPAGGEVTIWPPWCTDTEHGMRFSAITNYRLWFPGHRTSGHPPHFKQLKILLFFFFSSSCTK